jgi:hypothetical protein
MRLLRRLPILAAVAAALPVAGRAADPPPADLTKVPRSIAREPAYQGQPRYCLLAFGPDARARVWLVQDGNTLYVDRDGDGDLTEPGERVDAAGAGKADRLVSFAAGDVRAGGRTHTKLTVTRMQATREYVRPGREWDRVKAANPDPVIWAVRVTAERDPVEGEDGLPKAIGYVANGDGLGFLLFADRPADAPVIHFNGRWTLGLQDINQRIVLGKPQDLQIGVGTPGVGPGTFAFVLYPGLIPEDAYPVADIRFPAESPGGPPVTAHIVLKRRC